MKRRVCAVIFALLWASAAPLAVAEEPVARPLTTTPAFDLMIKPDWVKPPASPVVSVTAQQLRSDGLPRNASLIRVLFRDRIGLGDPAGIRISAPVSDPASGRRLTIAIPLISAAIANGRELRLVTGRLVPRGAELRFGLGALTGDVGPALLRVTDSDLEARHFVLALRAFRGSKATPLPRRQALALPAAVVQPPQRRGVYHDFARFMRRKQALGLISQAELRALLERFKAPETRAIIPHPKLRAALLSLAGTAFEAAIEAVLDGDNQSGRPYAAVFFGHRMPAGVVAEGRLRLDGGFTIVLNRRHRGEPFAALSALMAHEPLHQDPLFNGLNEEAISQVAETLAYAQQLLVAPELARTGSALTRIQNAALLRLLNSGATAFPDIGVKPSPVALDAGPVRLRAHAALGFEAASRTVNRRAGRPDIDTPGNRLLDRYMRNITGRGALADLDFDRATLDLIDSGQVLVDRDTALRLARSLRLSILPAGLPQ